MDFDEETLTLACYINWKKDILRDFCVFERITQDELEKLDNAKNEIQADIITKSLINKYLGD